MRSLLFFILFLFLVIFVSHQEWFKPLSILTTGDWLYWYKETMVNYLTGFGSWLGDRGLGQPNITLYYVGFEIPWSLMVRLGLDTNAVSKLILFIPLITFGFFSPFFLVRKLINNDFIAFISALFYGSTSYFLILQASHIPIALVYSITPLIFYFFIDALENNKKTYWLLFSLSYSLGAIYELRIMYVVSIILFIYFVYFFYLKGWKIIPHYYKSLVLTSLIILLLNLYWFLPILLGDMSRSIENIAGRGLFGDSLANILRGLTIFSWAWTGFRPDKNFNPQPIMNYFWVLPFFIFSIFLFKNNRYLKRIIYFLVISLLGIILVKQSAPPFAGLYSFLRDYFPGFIIFRESSKFYLIVSFGYLGLLAFGLKLLYENVSKRFFAIFCLLLIALFMWNLKPLITKEYGTLFVSRSIPKDYVDFKSHIVNEKKDFRTLWIPTVSRWAFNTSKNPKVSMVDISQQDWKRFIAPNSNLSTGKKLINFLNQSYAGELLNEANIRYIGIPLQDKTDLEDQLFEYYGESREFYIKALDKLSYLKRINLGTSDLVVYENKDYKPRVYLTIEQETIRKDVEYKDVGFKIVNSAQYKVEVKNVKEPFYLNFSESYHSNWKVYVGEFAWWKVLPGFRIEDLGLKKIRDKNHFQNDATLNSFRIDPKQVCKVESCKINSDGTYDISATIYFKPQSYFYLGSIISLSTLAVILSFLAFRGIKSLRRRLYHE